jgi:succinate dehydrogenase/fumarate reductase flavoprotein subunit
MPLYVTARGLMTSPIFYDWETFEILFDFIEHDLLIQQKDGTAKTLRLAARSVGRAQDWRTTRHGTRTILYRTRFVERQMIKFVTFTKYFASYMVVFLRFCLI